MSESKTKSSLFTEFIESTTLHGIRNVFCVESKFRRFVWFLWLVGSTAMFVVFSLNLIKSYLTGEVITRVTLVNQDSVLFPAVTLCNFNVIRKRFVPLLNLSDPDSLSQYMRGEILNFSNEDWQKLGNYSDDFFVHASHNIEDMLLNCTFQGKECRHEDFKPVYTNMGACYTFDYNKRIAQFGQIGSPGERYGLAMVLNAELYQYYVSEAIGFKVLVHEKNEFPLVEGNGFAIMPAVSTFVAIKKNKVKSLPAPYETNCENKQLIGNKSIYTKPLCYENCRRKYVLNECGCYYGDTEDIEDVFSCTLGVIFGCVTAAMTNFATLSKKNCSCPRPCERITYDTTLSFAMFALENYEAIFHHKVYEQNISKHNISEKDLSRYYARNNLAEVKIFFQDLNYHVLEDIPKQNLENLLAGAGGMLGLLLGASVLTLVEFLDFLITLLRMKYSETKTRNVVVSKPSSDITD